MVLIVTGVLFVLFSVVDCLGLGFVLGFSLLLLYGVWEGGFFGGVVYDELSVFLVFLSLMVFVLSVLSMVTLETSGLGSFFLINYGIYFLVSLSFLCSDYVLFYVSFESAFVLLFIYLMGWGNSMERLSASFYMVFYTLFVSFPFLSYLLVSKVSAGSGGMLLVGDVGGLWWFLGWGVFLVKLPAYGVHVWLPKAHVEAPVGGSMVLAGVLLKLGVYGFVRFIGVVGGYFSLWGGYVFSLGLVGCVWSYCLCMRQVDFKSLVAYSSVGHMGLALCGVYSFSFCGLQGGLMMLFSHGFCSSCLFFIVFCFYTVSHSRSVLVSKGFYLVGPVHAGWAFLFFMLNMGLPPSLSFFSEVSIVLSTVVYDWFSILVTLCGCFFSGVVNVFAFSMVSHGQAGGFEMGSGSILEFLVMGAHFFFLWVVVLFLFIFF